MNINRCKSELLEIFEKNKVKLRPLYKKAIDQILSHRGKNWIDIVDSETKERTLNILNLTKKLKPNTSYEIDKIISELDKIKFVYDKNNNWSFINKLNTNMSDAPIFIIDLLEKSSKYDIYEILEEMSNGNFSGLSIFLQSLPEHADFIWNKFLSDEDRYTQNIRQNSKDGDIIENLVADHYLNNGWEIVYRGENGDLIDMKLGVDLIVRKNDEYRYVQVKKLNSISNVTINNKNFIRFGGNVIIMNDLSTKILDTIAYSNTNNGNVFPLDRQSFYHRKPGDLVKYFGLPIPHKETDFEVLIEN